MKQIYREISKLYNSKTISAIASGDFSAITRISNKFIRREEHESLSAYFEKVYDYLGNSYRTEYYFKNNIALRQLLGRHSLKTATMLSEFRVGASKADCVIFNGKSTCYEIKTDYDSLVRLPEQLNDYSKLFDEIYVVCGDKNKEAVLDCVPQHVGVLVLRKNNYFTHLKKAQRNNTPTDASLLMKSLRKDESIKLVTELGGDIPDMPNSMLYSYCVDFLEGVDNKALKTKFNEIIKHTRVNKADLINQLPPCLTNAAISYQLSAKQEEALIAIFK